LATKPGGHKLSEGRRKGAPYAFVSQFGDLVRAQGSGLRVFLLTVASSDAK